MPVEGVLNQRQNERSEVSGEAPQAMPVEGVLNQRQNERSEVSGEAPQAYACGGGAEPH